MDRTLFPVNDTHPVELAVQSMLGPNLEKLNRQLESLHESQATLIMRLQIMQADLDQFDKRCFGSGVASEQAQIVQRVTELKKRLRAVNKTLGVVAGRMQARVPAT
ncbi:hypothetical protein BABINDRAFT_166255 [Babjeviella inositovora NRRL Y-12698]|uniref:Uncharacterized protein n=1 Tax=Babjeviella inositovora NRRL Y-12698 TaxID=984486 RepID=A0A1E3QUJ0_9ASCO|nr:uncharacterized protein BABINDRAFT_166255 [Babjeviella inositovora NRRL Y-12698]ODQ80652.1 hypothetical protein BABINDRAFT_166255 [Babjeviella inositovora NRRL Y-12698]